MAVSEKPRKFTVRHGEHVHEGRTYLAGEPIMSKTDLRLAFPNKFRLGADVEEDDAADNEADVEAQLAAEEAATSQRANPASVPDPSVKTNKPNKAFGRDVSEAYPAAGEAGLLVFQQGAHHTVTSVCDPSVALNSKKLKKTEVAQFIENYIDEINDGAEE